MLATAALWVRRHLSKIQNGPQKPKEWPTHSSPPKNIQRNSTINTLHSYFAMFTALYNRLLILCMAAGFLTVLEYNTVSPSDGDFVIGPCRLQRPGMTAGNR